MGVTNSTKSKPSIVENTDAITSFYATEVHWVIITNQVYDKNRPYKDIKYVFENAATIKRTFNFLKITNITELTDCTMKEFEIFFSTMKLKYQLAD